MMLGNGDLSPCDLFCFLYFSEILPLLHLHIKVSFGLHNVDYT